MSDSESSSDFDQFENQEESSIANSEAIASFLEQVSFKVF
jgi:hypothetical protein